MRGGFPPEFGLGSNELGAHLGERLLVIPLDLRDGLLERGVSLPFGRERVHLVDEIVESVFGDLPRVELIPCLLALALCDAVKFTPQRQSTVVEERERGQ